jgi:hypothetical protein
VIARVVALWVFGLLGASIFGGILGHGLTQSGEGSFFGALGGAFVFACARLWLTPPRARKPRTEMPVPSAHAAEGRPARFAKWVAGALAFGLAFVAAKSGTQWVREGEPGLTGSTRTTFVENAVRECVATQNRDPANKGISHKLISDYCLCYANGVADRVSVRELKQYSEIGQERAVKAMESKIAAAGEPCLDAAAKAAASHVTPENVPFTETTLPGWLQQGTGGNPQTSR